MMGSSLGRLVGINVRLGHDLRGVVDGGGVVPGLAHTFKRGEMIRVGLLLDRLSDRVRWVMEILALSIALTFVGFLAWNAAQLALVGYRINDMSTGIIAVPLWIPQLGMVVGSAILALALLDELLHVLRGNWPSYHKPPPATAHELIERVAEGGGVDRDISSASPESPSLVLLTLLIVILSTGVWIAAALGLVGIAAIVLTNPVPIGSNLAQSALDRDRVVGDLGARALHLDGPDPVPHAALGGDVRGLSPWLQWLPGRLLHVNVVGCGIFAAASSAPPRRPARRSARSRCPSCSRSVAITRA